MRRENENLLKFSDDVKKRNDITERLREGDVFSLSSRKGHFTLKFGKPEDGATSITDEKPLRDITEIGSWASPTFQRPAKSAST